MTLDDDGAEATAVQYVLGELRPDEAADFERHLAGDAALAAEVRRLRTALGLLPLATATDPPPGLRDRILTAAVAQARAPVAPRTPVAARAPRRVVWSRFAAAAAAVLALALGLDAVRVRRELRLQQELAETLLQPDVVHRFALAGSGGSYGTVALDMDAKRGAVVLKGMPGLPPGQVYRLWAQVADRSIFCGDFRATGEGAVQAQFVVPVESYTAPVKQLFVTVEPAGPPAEPTGPRVMTSV
jgi:anti-sigma-K factor RskA